MFICDGCREKKYANPASIGFSVGRCESCGREKVCSDIPSSALREKRKKKVGGKRG